jgi:2-polyprenyl-6-methoxyphenol hydroxylase-like FAD-dependent oxidoreductase
MNVAQHVLILGGGLAGLTLALQLKRQAPNLSITVLEARPKNAPTASHKVGESTVELGTYYLREVLGLGPYLDQHQLPKTGLRFFFSPHLKEQIDQRVELGASTSLPIPSHQIDRGLFENDLIEQLSELGVTILLGAKVETVVLGTREEYPHVVSYMHKGAQQLIKGDWLVDASGRSSLLKRRLKLQNSIEHQNNAVWFRFKGEIDIDEWSDNAAWRGKFAQGLRRLSTVHLMGTGYWVWLIPLVSGYTSVGIVTDPNFHDLREHHTWLKALAWLHKHEPLCARQLAALERGSEDFKQLKNYPLHCTHFYSTRQWGIVGEAGAFLDPLYSPGTDFIALGNTWMSDLIVRQHGGENVAGRSILYDRIFRAFFESWIPIYQQQYALFGHSQIMVVKILWDWTLYWGFPCLLFTNNAFTDLAILRAVFVQKSAVSQRIKELNRRMQQFFQDWATWEKTPAPHCNQFVDFMNIPFIKRIHLGLQKPHTPEQLLQQCKGNLQVFEKMAVHIYQKIRQQYDSLYQLNNINPYQFALYHSREIVAQQAQSVEALSSDPTIVKDMEAFWLNQTTTV